ncbi:hypothetical protein LTR85_001597 [Meristemomyces frigidus]|nr:hypothetical protein LTR85_001597 [Meristemomyces frigidus]
MAGAGGIVTPPPDAPLDMPKTLQSREEPVRESPSSSTKRARAKASQLAAHTPPCHSTSAEAPAGDKTLPRLLPENVYLGYHDDGANHRLYNRPPNRSPIFTHHNYAMDQVVASAFKRARLGSIEPAMNPRVLSSPPLDTEREFHRREVEELIRRGRGERKVFGRVRVARSLGQP